MSQHIHIVSFAVPFPADYGGVIDVFFRVKALAENGLKIHLHCFLYDDRKPSECLEKMCWSVNYYRRDVSFLRQLSMRPYIVTSRDCRELVENLSKDDYPILLEGLHCCSVLEKISNRRIFVRTHNVEHDYYSELAKVEKNIFKKSFFLLESKRLKKYENVLQRASGILCITKKDYDYFSARYDNVSLVPPLSAFPEVAPFEGCGDYVLYHGRLDVVENLSAVCFILDEIFPDDAVKLKIAGLNPPKGLYDKVDRRENTELIANPSDEEMLGLVRNAQVNLLVTAQDTGLKLKLLNALYNGRHCLVNEAMVVGTGLAEACEIRNDAKSLRERCLTLMNENLSSEMISKRREILSAFCDNKQIINDLISAIC